MRFLGVLILVWGCTACGSDVPTFDGERAFAYLVKQCDFGSRVPGSQAHSECLRYLTTELQSSGAQVTHQSFQQALPGTDSSETLTNIIASFGLGQKRRVLLCAHWDSRPTADQDSNSAKHNEPVLGANDGASGVAVLLEVAKNIQTQEPKYGVDIIFFDGEDSGLPERPETYALGSQYFANNKDPRYRPEFGILLDMVGDSTLQIYQEGNSLRLAPHIVEKVWERAEKLGLNAFLPSPGPAWTDDHLPLLRAGIPCIDLIDSDYPYWHTSEDTPDKCSPQSLAQVGQLLLSLLYDP
ncbi:M28 family peptidase [bacterium]|nr:M28 family peptidase [bacterium]